MSRCILFEPTKFDIKGIDAYGESVYLFDDIPRRPLKDQLLECQIIDRLEGLGFDPESDFVVLSGAQLSVLILATTIVSYYGPVRMLAFDSVTQEYFERSMGHSEAIEERKCYG